MKQTTAAAIEEQTQDRKAHTIWVGEEDRVVSFHAVGTYRVQTFDCHDFFMKYLCALQERGFRFQ